MALLEQDQRTVTFEEFLRFLDTRPNHERWDLIHGVITATGDLVQEQSRKDRGRELTGGGATAMAGVTQEHAQIARTVSARLGSAGDARGCRTYISDMLIRYPEPGDARTSVAPDVVVTCGPPQRGQRFIDDPVAVVEVLSPSTMDHDRGEKLIFYKEHPSIQHIALIYQDEMRIETWRRVDGQWQLDILKAPDQHLRLEALDLEISLSEVYSGVDF